MDAAGSAIRIDTRGREVMRILPVVNEDVNEEWISDKTRFIWDGLKTQRLDRPYVREDGRLRPASWSEAFALIAEKVKATQPSRIGAIAGDLNAVEEIFALRQLMQALGSPNLDCRQDGTQLNPAFGRGSYLFNATIAGVEDADAALLIGSNPRREAPVLNARIRKRWLAGNLPVAYVGEAMDLTYRAEQLGAGAQTLVDLANGAHGFVEVLRKAQRPLIIIGQGALARADGAAVLAAATRLAVDVGAVGDDWNGLSILHTAAARVGALDVGFFPAGGGLTAQQMAAAGALDVVYLLGADEIEIAPGAFVIYQGSHGDSGAHRADVILPGAAYPEKSGTYLNTEGRVQVADRASFPPGDAREDWAIIRALSDVLGHRLGYDNLGALREALVTEVPHMADRNQIAAGALELPAIAAAIAQMGPAPFASPIVDFYLTNPIARASAVMAECSALARGAVAQAAE